MYVCTREREREYPVELFLFECLFHLMYLSRFETESAKVGKSSFAFAWVLDETGEERHRCVCRGFVGVCACMHGYPLNT